MWILYGYLTRTMVVGTLLVLAILLLLNLVFGFIGELDNLKGAYDAPAAFGYSVLKTPYFLVKVFPLALLIGTVFALGKLSDQSETTVMLASGVPTAKLLRMILFIGMTLVAVAMLLTEWVVPKAERAAQQVSQVGAPKTFFQQTRYGVWLLQGGKLFHIRSMRSAQRMQGVSVFSYEGQTLVQIKRAKQAHLSETGDWFLSNVTTLDFTEEKVQQSKRAKETIPAAVSSDVLAQIQMRPDKLATVDLLDQREFLHENQLNTETVEVELWKRVAYPFSALLMLFLAFPFILKSGRFTSLSQKVLLGVMFGVLFYVFSRIVEQFGLLYDTPVWAPVFAPIGIFFLLGLRGYQKI